MKVLLIIPAYKGEEILLIIKEKDKESRIKCFEKDKISTLYEKYNAKGIFTYNFKILDDDSTFRESRVNNFSIIDVINPNDGMNVIFKTTSGIMKIIALSIDCPVGLAIIYFLIEYNPFYLFSFIKNKKCVRFSFNIGRLLFIQDETTIANFFKIRDPKVIVSF